MGTVSCPTEPHRRLHSCRRRRSVPRDSPAVAPNADLLLGAAVAADAAIAIRPLVLHRRLIIEFSKYNLERCPALEAHRTRKRKRKALFLLCWFDLIFQGGNSTTFTLRELCVICSELRRRSLYLFPELLSFQSLAYSLALSARGRMEMFRYDSVCVVWNCMYCERRVDYLYCLFFLYFHFFHWVDVIDYIVCELRER